MKAIQSHTNNGIFSLSLPQT